MRKAEIIVAGFLGAIGIVTIIESFRLGIGYEIWGPQAGFIISAFRINNSYTGQGWETQPCPRLNSNAFH